MASLASSKSKSRSHGRDKDIISTLPDAILSHMLSFLPTKYAVLTSNLSTRWRYIWTLVPSLDFDDSLNLNSQNLFPSVSFVDFVDRVLLLRDRTTCIQKFHLSCRLKYISSHFNTWICYVIAYGVRDLNLSYLGPNYVHLPRSLFTCNMLEALKLNMDFHMHIPDIVRLQKLRVLHLISLPFLNDSSIENLISGCPVLEELVIYRDKNDSLKNLKIRSSSLNSLNIHTDVVPHSQLPDYENRCSLSIDAPFLEYLDIADHIFGVYNVSELSSVVKANIEVWESYEDEEIPDDSPISVLELFRGIRNVKHLTVSTNTLMRIFVGMPTFRNVTHLEVKVQLGGWEELPDLLSYMPAVKELVVEKDYPDYGRYWLCIPYSVLKCFSGLETIEIRKFIGCPHEMEFARYFLEISVVLKKMTICSCNIGLETQFNALKILTGFPRGSKICKLVFS